MPDLLLENSYQGHVIGIDEAGRGPWAGPVTITALWLNPDSYNQTASPAALRSVVTAATTLPSYCAGCSRLVTQRWDSYFEPHHDARPRTTVTHWWKHMFSRLGA